MAETSKSKARLKRALLSLSFAKCLVLAAKPRQVFSLAVLPGQLCKGKSCTFSGDKGKNPLFGLSGFGVGGV